MGFDGTGNESLPVAQGRQVLGGLLLSERFQPSEILEFGAHGIRAGRIHAGSGSERRTNGRKP
jgi:hypothetical protein